MSRSEHTTNGTAPPSLRDRFGICQWFHYEEHEDVLKTIDLLADLGVKHLRTGISWADFVRPRGEAWYDWQMQALRDAGLEVLLSVWHTPPSLAESNTCMGPPRVLKDYADFIDLIINKYGDCFDALELWNEPNNRLKWNFEEYDPQWKKFGKMIGMASYWAQQCGKTTVLGGMIPVDHTWLELMQQYGALAHIDIVAIHGFPEMWWPDAPNWDWYSHWHGWAHKINYIAAHAGGRPIWVTETGLATWDLQREEVARHDLQVSMLERAAVAPSERVYWYCALDLPPDREAIEGFHIDENEYHLGLVTHTGAKKPAYHRLKALLADPRPLQARRAREQRRAATARKGQLS